MLKVVSRLIIFCGFAVSFAFSCIGLSHSPIKTRDSLRWLLTTFCPMIGSALELGALVIKSKSLKI